MTTTATTYESTLEDYARADARLRDAILALSDALDPHHQGEQWPDPIAWDGRPLDRQASDLLALADNPDASLEVEAAAADMESVLDDRDLFEQWRPYIVADAEGRTICEHSLEDDAIVAAQTEAEERGIPVYVGRYDRRGWLQTAEVAPDGSVHEAEARP